ncbi:MAG TPA: hypothetical protein VGM98_19625 [Schlesneria sp.]|jgi:hypothetical protein
MRDFYCWAILIMLACSAATAIAEEPVGEADAVGQIESLGGRINRQGPMGLAVNFEPVPTVTIQFWWIVVPLTLISAYLLLSKRSPDDRAKRAPSDS